MMKIDPFKAISDLWQKLTPKGLVPPSDVEMEEALLGACMIDKASATRTIEIIGPRTEEDSPFYRTAHTLIYLAMLRLAENIEREEPIDLLTVKNQLAQDGRLDDIGGSTFLVELTNKIVTTVNVQKYARIILEKYVSREIIRVCEEHKLRAFEGELDSFAQATELEAQISDIAETRHLNSARFRPIQQVSIDTIRLLEQAGKHEGGGLSTGLKDLDDLLDGGPRAGDIVILAGRSSQGKTSMSDTVAKAISMGANAHGSTAIFSLEMSGPQLVMRSLCGEAGIPLKKARKGLLDDNDWREIALAHSRLSAAGIYLTDVRSINLSTIRSSARHLATKLAKTDRPLKRIILDYIALPKLPGKQKQSQEIGELAKSLRDLAGELGTDLWALSQITRDVMKRKPPRPMLSDIAESGDLEEIADIALLLYRPEMYSIYADDEYIAKLGTPATEGVAEVIVAKQRNGETGKVLAKFVKAEARFEDWPAVFPKEEPITDQGKMAF